ncbi:MAG: hypothetical protein ACTTJW_01040 [Sphaerochaeta sp.]
MAIVTFQEYQSFTNVTLSPEEFSIIAERAQELLETLCRCKFSNMDQDCKRAVLHQIEYIQILGGLAEWQRVSGAIAGRSYSIGGESESLTFVRSESEEGGKRFNGLNISSTAWAILANAGYVRSIREIRTCY